MRYRNSSTDFSIEVNINKMKIRTYENVAIVKLEWENYEVDLYEVISLNLH